jgi:sialic acid synthase SpsE
MNKKIKIGSKFISLENPTYFIADIAANWDGSLERAKDLIYLAAEMGADAAKFQNFNAETIVSDYGFKKLNNGKQLSHHKKWRESVFEVYKKASLPLEWTEDLKNTCIKAGIDYFTAPYDENQIEELSKHVFAWKVGSGDITWVQMIEKLSKYNLPILIATGASTQEEVNTAYKTAKKFNDKIIIMQCNTNYTSSPKNFKYINLNVLKTFKLIYPEAILGLSDHTPGHSTVLGAITLGARVIEKHFTDANNREGPDHKFSMNPKEWRLMVDHARELEDALGSEIKKIEDNEKETFIIQRRSIRAIQDLFPNTTIKKENLTFLRPCPTEALKPSQINMILNKKVKRKIKKGDIIRIDDLF